MIWCRGVAVAWTSLAVVICTACGSGTQEPPESASFVGRHACAPCHELELAAYTGSYHDLAMDHASEVTVVGDFNNVEFTHQGVTSRFYRRDGGYFVRTEGEDGELHEYQVEYTFGVWPLQQYLVRFPGGRYQTLPLCWDSRAAEAGGQRWFHLYGDERIAPADELFWTRVSQNWNYQCAECHSTDLRKNYDPATRTYATTWSEIDVSCEACHGPGSRHVTWAEAARRGDTLPWKHFGLDVELERRVEVEWLIKAGDSTAQRTSPVVGTSQVDLCARCHSRRSTETEYVFGKSLLETHHPALLSDPLYFPDGQIKDEVYEYGSFLQSKMYRAGVVCSDCHDAHSGNLYIRGDGLCQRCHQAEKYAVPTHHFHNVDSTGARCIGCHMPQRHYMVVDERADHSMRVPRPDLTVSLGVPNSCNGCHADRSAEWAVETCDKWYGPPEPHPFAETFDAARKGDRRAGARLVTIAADTTRPAVVRATALELLGSLGAGGPATIRQGTGSPDPLMRMAAVEAAASLAAEIRQEVVRPLLADSSRLVRVTAARQLAELPRPVAGSAEAMLLDSTVAEYMQSQLYNADHPSSWLNIGNLFLASGDLERSRRAFETALAVDSTFMPAYVNLADWHRAKNDDAGGRRVLEAALDRDPADAGANHSLGLLLIREGRHDSALIFLERAARSQPASARYAYVYAAALHSAGRAQEADAIVNSALEQNPFDLSLLEMRLTLNLESGDGEEALRTVRSLRALAPEREDYRQLEADLVRP